MTDQREIDAAYFTLLRAREELSTLTRYAEYLGEEQRRLRRFLSEGDARADELPAPVRRPLVSVDAALREAVETRIEVLADELGRLPPRVEAAGQFVEECEAEHAALQGSNHPG